MHFKHGVPLERGFSFHSFLPPCCVNSLEGRKETLPPFESMMVTVGRMVFSPSLFNAIFQVIDAPALVTCVSKLYQKTRTNGEMLRTMKNATETRVGGRLETDHLLISWMVRHCCWIFCTPFEVLRNNSYRGGLACFGEVVWALVPGTRLLRGKTDWGTTENTEEHLCGDEHGVRKFRTTARISQME